MNDHNINDFTFYIYTSNIIERELNHMEAKLIYLFRHIYYVKLLNVDEPNPYSYAYYSNQKENNSVY